MGNEDAPEISSDIADLAEQAKVVAKATGRDEADVLADLLDDGKLNNSHKEEEKDLVTQLKEAAALITTVQSINSEVSQNTVLNGGENKTEVKVETTLEGDMVDRAIASVHRKAENIKKIALIFVPVFLILSGGTMEGMGWIDIFGNDDDGGDDGDYIEYYGCMDSTADNYDEYANIDDGSCYYDNGGGGIPPPCDWIYENTHYQEGNTIYIDTDFMDLEGCDRNMRGYFDIYLYWNEGEDVISHRIDTGDFKHSYSVNHAFEDLGDGDFEIVIEFHDTITDSWWGDGPYYYTVNNEQSIDITNIDSSLTPDGDLKLEFEIQLQGNFNNNDPEIILRLWLDDEEQHDLERVIFHSYGEDYGYIEQYWSDLENGEWLAKVFAEWEGELFDEETFETVIIEDDDCTPNIQSNGGNLVRQSEDPNNLIFDIQLELYDDNACDPSEVDTLFDIYLDGEHMEGPVGQTETILGDMNNPTNLVFAIDPAEYEGREPYGVWTVQCRWIPEGQSEQFCEDTLGPLTIEEPEPEICEINLYDIAFGTNSTAASIAYDLDCGNESNDFEGYNVTIQFLVYHVNETNSGPNATGPLQWLETTHYIQGWEEDVHTLLLDDFLVNNTTHYDFYWYAFWEDGEGEFQILEETWLNRELEP